MVASFRIAGSRSAKTGEAERELRTAEDHRRQAAESKGTAGTLLAASTRRNLQVAEESDKTQQLYARASAERRMLRFRLDVARETREERRDELAELNAALAAQQAERATLNGRSALLRDQRAALAEVHSASVSSAAGSSSVGAMALEDRLRAEEANEVLRHRVAGLVSEILAADRETEDFEQTTRTLEQSLQDLRRPESVASALSVHSIPSDGDQSGDRCSPLPELRESLRESLKGSRSSLSPDHGGPGAVETARALADQLDRDRQTAQLRLDLARQQLGVLEGRAKILNGELDGQRGCMEALHTGTLQELLEAKDLCSASSRTQQRISLEHQHEQRKLLGAALGSFSSRCSPSPLPPSLAGSTPSPELRESLKVAASAAPVRPLAPLTARSLRSDLAFRKGAWSPSTCIVGD